MLDFEFPASIDALEEPNGLLAMGGDLSPQRLLHAYSRGIFPWFSSNEPILWWAPDPRAVLVPSEFKVSKSFGKSLKKRGYRLSLNLEFLSVVRACAAPRRSQEGTWILPSMISAYSALHRLGYAHSIEVWRQDVLIGGLYGVCLGKAFFGESMFSIETDASKAALASLAYLGQMGYFEFIDCQVESQHLTSMGARSVNRESFEHKLENAISEDMEQVRQIIKGVNPTAKHRVPWGDMLPESAAELLLELSA
ncbi:MAG: leucyl/phenylalanyl-tRNA--protein transferase [Luminiphilus sp.]|nr:leucyl/phenylalanyl-tRNA--protein transferase [Luminiphilus sp.]